MARKVKERERLAYTFTLHTSKDAELIEHLADKSTTAYMKELIQERIDKEESTEIEKGPLMIPADKVLLDKSEFLRLVELSMKVAQQQPVVQGVVQQPVPAEPISNAETESKKELTEEQQKKVNKIKSKIGRAVAQKRNEKEGTEEQK